MWEIICHGGARLKDPKHESRRDKSGKWDFYEGTASLLPTGQGSGRALKAPHWGSGLSPGQNRFCCFSYHEKLVNIYVTLESAFLSHDDNTMSGVTGLRLFWREFQGVGGKIPPKEACVYAALAASTCTSRRSHDIEGDRRDRFRVFRVEVLCTEHT